ncbi:MAG: prepilin-type N-terminal cleavage/methylation domain-containing protein [Elusimicrobiaceae bacterium]|nr:prepilin-type N-terminal cleavage/methylation domain-containing protein [Elusimicrobiaceae bacterium]
MKNKKGFTLVELLVAATILGILAVFATTSYRNSVAENHWAQARAVTKQLAGSLQRVKMDYPFLSFEAGKMTSNVYLDTVCPLDSTLTAETVFRRGDLISCGYLEGGAWKNKYFEYWVCGSTPSTAPCNSTSHQDNEGQYPLACVTVKETAKLPSQFLSNTFCVHETGEAKECRVQNSAEVCVPI